MVDLYGFLQASVDGLAADEPAGCQTTYTFENGEGTCIITGMRDFAGYQDFYRFFFYAIEEGKTTLRIRGDAIGYNKYGTEGYTDRTIGTISTDNTAVLTPTNGGRLLTLANTYKDVYFGGITQTPQSLMDYLNTRYGDHAGYYYENLVGGNVVEYLDRVPEVTAADYKYDYSTTFHLWEPDPVISFQKMWVSPAEAITDDDLAAFFIFGEFLAPTELQFDVWIDGEKEPNVAVTWQAIRKDSQFSLQTVSPKVWCYPLANISIGQTPIITNDDDIVVPNEEQWYVNKHAYTWVGEYKRPYLSEFEDIASGLSTIEKIAYYGFDGIPSGMWYYLRFDQSVYTDNTGFMTWDTLFGVFVPQRVDDIEDISVLPYEDSQNNPHFSSKVVIHLGKPPSDADDDSDQYPDGTDADGNPGGVYDPDGTIPDFSTGVPSGFPGQSILTTTYSMDSATLQNIGTKLWTQSYLDVLKVQSNPIENIVSCKWYPFSITGSSGSVVIGDIDFGINAGKISNIYRFSVGSVAVPKKYNSFLDCSPFTTIKLHLPYCGIIQLDASEMWGRTIYVDYVVDLITGDCLALISLDKTTANPAGIPYLAVSGSCGVDIPLTSTNRVQAEMKAASMTLSAVVGAGGHLMGGDMAGAAVMAGSSIANLAGMDFTSQRSGTHSAACQSYNNRWVYLEVSSPAFDEDIYDNEGFDSRHGFPTHKFMTLSSLCQPGSTKEYFVKCDARTKISFAMTGEENRMLEQLLTDGVYIRSLEVE